MTKFSASLLAISFFIMTLGGCAQQPKAVPQKNFTAQAQFKVNDMVVKADVCSSEGENVIIEVTYPDNLKGLTYQRSNSTLYIDYGTLRSTTVADYLPDFNPFSAIIDSLCLLKVRELEYISAGDSVDVYRLKSDNGEINISFCADSGLITEMKPSYTDLSIKFSAVKA